MTFVESDRDGQREYAHHMDTLREQELAQAWADYQRALVRWTLKNDPGFAEWLDDIKGGNTWNQ